MNTTRSTRLSTSLPRPLRHLLALAIAALMLAGCAAGEMMPPAAQAEAAGAPAADKMAVDLAAPLPRRELPDGAPPAMPLPAAVPADEPVAAERQAREAEAIAPMPAMDAEMGMAEPVMLAEADDMGRGGDELEWAWELDDGEWERGWNDEDWGGGGPGGGWEPPPPPVQYAAARQFPVPDYSQDYAGPRVDFRETIYWNPSVRTDANGTASVSFYLSDAVTSFRASAEGLLGDGRIARTEEVISSKLPVSLAVKLPVEVTRGDRVELPITLANDTDETQTARLTTQLGAAFELVSTETPVPDSVELAAGERRSFRLAARVVGDGKRAADGRIKVAIDAGSGFTDEMERTLRVVPEGFPFEKTFAGALTGEPVVHRVSIPPHLPATLDATLRLYPSPTSTMLSGMESMLRQPGGCFEQTSSSNYPNIMVLDYMAEHDALQPELVARAQGFLDTGYNLLTGYESASGGFEWFGADPGHEALTAYGVMQFVQMDAVYDVDDAMVERTVDWLLSRRDGNGGYTKNPHALHTWANSAVTDAYITWALTEVGQTDLEAELDATRKLAKSSDDAYVLALAANTLVNVEPEGKTTQTALDRLVELQDDTDGAWRQAQHSVVLSGGINLAIETTALATLALMEDPRGTHTRAVNRGIEFIRSQNNGYGGFGTTQATVLALQALTAHAANSAAMPDDATLTVEVNDHPVAEFAFDGDMGDEMVIGGLAEHLHEGDNRIEILLAVDGEAPVELPYSVQVEWREAQPKSSRKSPVGLTTSLSAERVALGESVRMSVELDNRKDQGLPMVLGRIGIPGGLSAQTWQLEELVDKKIVDFYETREREVIVYYRGMAPNDVRRIDLDLVAAVPGTYQAPASRAYLYYTDEDKTWVDPVAIEVTP